jgi:hypothetical protein
MCNTNNNAFSEIILTHFGMAAAVAAVAGEKSK